MYLQGSSIAPGIPPSDIVELLAAGPYVRAFLSDKAPIVKDPDDSNGDAAAQDVLNHTTTAFATFSTDYHRPTGTTLLAGWADEVPSAVQVSLAEPAQNAAIWSPGEAGVTVSLASGDALLSATDHTVHGRGLSFSFDRTYRSGMLGYGPLGAAPWNASLFAHVREIGTTGEADYHDGEGHVWRFVPTKKDGKCIDGFEKDDNDSYCSPKGLYLRLRKLEGDKGWKLIGRENDSALFDFAGRLIELSDRHRQRNTDPDAQGNTMKLRYNGYGEFAQLEDDLGRAYRLKYEDDPASPKYGLIKSIEDFVEPEPRTLKFDFGEDGRRRLMKVQLPKVENEFDSAYSHLTPTVEYVYSSNSLGTDAPLTSTKFEPLKLESFKLPGASNSRVTLEYDSATGRTSKVKFPTSANWGLTWTPASTAAPVTEVVLTSPWSQSTEQTLKDGSTEWIRERDVETLRPDDSTPSANGSASQQTLETHFEYECDGRMNKITRPDRSETTYDFASSCTGTDDRIIRGNVLKVHNRPGSAPTGFATGYTESSTGLDYSGDNIPKTATDDLQRTSTSAISMSSSPGSTSSDVSSGFSADPVAGTPQISGTSNYDSFGRLSHFKSGSTQSPEVNVKFKSFAGKANKGFVEEVSTGGSQPVKETFEYDGGQGDAGQGNVTKRTTSFGTSSETVYDLWDRPIKETTGIGGGGYGSVADRGAVVFRSYDEEGRLARLKRQQLGVSDEVTTDFTYNDRDQVLTVTQSHLAGAVAGLSPGFESGTTNYGYRDDGLLDHVTSPAGVVTQYQYDHAGRVSSTEILTAGSAPRRTAYDELGRTVFESDGDQGVWRGTFDAWGRMFKEVSPSGSMTEREFDAAGGLIRERLFDSESVSKTRIKETLTHVTNFGAVDRTSELLEPAPQGGVDLLRVTKRSFDDSGRMIRETSGSTDAKQTRVEGIVEYEEGSGRVHKQTDGGGNETEFQYGAAGGGEAGPWPLGIIQREHIPGQGFARETHRSSLVRDAFGRVTEESGNDGITVRTGYDESGNVLWVETGVGTRTASLYDSRGSVVRIDRPNGGTTAYGYDPDGRPVSRAVGTAGDFTYTGYLYDTAGRLSQITRPDGTSEQFSYNSDDTLDIWTTRQGFQVKHVYDSANRLTARLPLGNATSNVVLDGGDTYAYDSTSRLLSASRLSASPLSVGFTGYDSAGRPKNETVGRTSVLRPPMIRGYDTWDRPIHLGLPAGAGCPNVALPPGADGPGFVRTYDDLDRVVTSDNDQSPTATGATWAWGGSNRLYGTTARGPLASTHRYAYIGSGLGAQPPTTSPPTANWRLGTLTVGSVTGVSPPTGTLGGSGTAAWGQFGFGYRSGDGSKLGRAVIASTDDPDRPSIFAGQGWAWGVDGGLRLTRADAGQGNMDGASSTTAEDSTEQFDFGYGPSDELQEMIRGDNASPTICTNGSEGRVLGRSDAPNAPYSYDAQGERTTDDRFDYTWDWRGQLVEVKVKNVWPAANGDPTTLDNPGVVSPYAGHRIQYEYDPLGRMTFRTHKGVLAATPTSDDDRPFIERREFVWEDDGLVAEAGYSIDGSLRWRKTYTPGPSGLDDAPQVKVEIYDPTVNPNASPAPPPTSEKLFTYLRDEQGTVTGIVEERPNADPAKPPVAVRYFYTPYGEAHAETGPELLRGEFDPSLRTVETSTGSATQSVNTATAAEGALRIEMSTTIDDATFNTGIVVEKVLSDGTVAALAEADRAIAHDPQDDGAILILPLAGWERGARYNVHLTSTLADTTGRLVLSSPALSWSIPTDGRAFQYAPQFSTQFESYIAAGDSIGGLFPGGQTMLFQSLWHDPVTGLAYARARWLDERNAVFLSEDPEDDVDSPNVYAFVGFRPNEFNDPFGLEEGDWWDARSYFGEAARARSEEFFFKGEVVGFVKAPFKLVGALAHTIAHPIDAAEGLAQVVAHPINTIKAAGNAFANASNAEQGEVVGDILFGLVSGAALKTTEAGNMSRLLSAEQKAARAEKVVSRAERLAAAIEESRSGSVARKFAKVAEEDAAIQRSVSAAEKAEESLAAARRARAPVKLAGPGEDLHVGSYGKSYRANVKSGLAKTHTPHHVIQDAASELSHGRGITINIRKGIHELTGTYKKPMMQGLSGRQRLAGDIVELRKLLKQAGYDRRIVNAHMRELIRQNHAW